MFSSCENEAYNEHYKRTYIAESNLKITEYLQGQSNLSTFYDMLVESGYDKVLSSPQTYTLWVPENAALVDFDRSDPVNVERLVKNHFARFVYSSNSDEAERIEVASFKVHEFIGGTNPSFGGMNIKESILTQNGVIYVLENYVPFRPNIFEYLGDANGFDSLYNYIAGQNIKVFDSIRSTVIGTDPETGARFYDSVSNDVNWIFELYGDLDLEDSIYTALFLDNQAWSSAYDSIVSYYKSFREDSIAIQKYFTQKTIVKDLFYRGELTNITMFDSIRSTSGFVLHNPMEIFEGATQKQVSNGTVYEVNKYNIKASDSFLKEIRIEAENKEAIGNNDNCNIHRESVFSSDFRVSNKQYISVEPTTTSALSKIRIDFNIEGTLATAYNIYVQFVPTSIQDTTDHRPFKAKYYMSYIDENQKEVSILRNKLVPDIEETNPDSLTKVLVAENFKFPYCDFSLDEEEPVSVILRVQNDVSTRETANYSREMKIDCVILEPVKQ